MTPASARFSGIGKSHVKCHPDSVPAFLFSINLSMPRPQGQRLSNLQNNQSVKICTRRHAGETPTAPEKIAARLDCAGRAQRRRRFRPAECARMNGRSRSKAGSRCACPRTPRRWRAGGARHSVRAAVANPDAPVGSRRRAEDCAPYPCTAPVPWRFSIVWFNCFYQIDVLRRTIDLLAEYMCSPFPKHQNYRQLY